MPIIATRYRPFNLVDGMFLIAATAIGIAPIRFTISLQRQMAIGGGRGHRHVFQSYVFAACEFLTPLLIAWSIAGLILYFRRPFSSCRELSRQPGFVACLLVVIVTLYYLITVAVPRLLPDATDVGATWVSLARLFPRQVGLAVGAGWLVIGLQRRWVRGETWADRFGCLIGWCWIGSFLVVTMYPLVTG
jgi:magnesium-transporting ATPase (P-type)